MPVATAHDFLEALKKCNLIPSDVLAELEHARSSASQQPTCQELAAGLVEGGHLTAWQAERLLAGQTRFFLGKYKLLERIGRGGMGVVFKARHAVMSRTVALKILDSQLVRSAEARLRFLREVKSLAALSHPNIVAAFDADCVDNTQFLVMEYVAGHDLRHYIQHVRPLDIPWCCEVVRQVALGLEHAHQRGFVHRDIKPGNLLVSVDPADGSYTIKILDLGLAKLTNDCLDDVGLTQAGKVVGTPDYIAPEQVENAGQIDIRADIFSLGCTLFEMLSGRRPYEGDSQTAKVMARLAREAPSVQTYRADVPPHLAQIVARMMSRDPAQRFQAPAEVAAALSPHTQDAAGESSTAVPMLPASASAGDSATKQSDLQEFFDRLGTHAVDDTPGRGSRTVSRSEWTGRLRAGRKPAWRQPQVFVPVGFGLLLLTVLGIAARLSAPDESPPKVASTGRASARAGLDPSPPVDGGNLEMPAIQSADAAAPVADDLGELLPQPSDPVPVASTDTAEAPAGTVESVAPANVLTLTTLDGPLDVLPLIEPEHALVGPAWTRESQGLVSAATDRAVLTVPVIPPSEYALSITLVRLTGTDPLTLGLPLGGRMAVVRIGGLDTPASLILADGTQATITGDPPSASAFVEGRTCTVICRCLASELTVTVDGQPAVHWSGNSAELAAGDEFAPADVRMPCLLASTSTYRIERLEFLPPDSVPSAVVVVPRLDVPSAEELAEARRRVNRDFREEIRGGTSPELKAALAKKLLEASRGFTEGPPHAYALLDRAREFAAQSADPSMIEEVVMELDSRFAVDAWDLRADGFKDAERQAKTEDQQRALAQTALGLVEGAALAERFDAAYTLANVARGLAVKAKDAGLVERASESRGDLKWRRVLWEAASAATEVLKETPDDGSARLAVGRYLCFSQRKWKEGLSHLARGNDAELAAVAGLEQAAADDPTRYPEAAAAWWQHQMHDRSDWRPLVQQRAINLYLEALPELAPPARAVVRVELDRMFKEAPILQPQPAAKGLLMWFRADAGVQRDDENRVFKWEDQSGNENHATQTNPKWTASYVPDVLNGNPVLRFDQTAPAFLSFQLPRTTALKDMSIAYLAMPMVTIGNGAVVVILSERTSSVFGYFGNSLGILGSTNLTLGSGSTLEADTSYLVGYLLDNERGCVTYLNGDTLGDAQRVNAMHSGAPVAYIGGSLNPNGAAIDYPFGGDIAEILIYDRALRPEEYRRVFIYLSHKYGLALRPPADGRLDE